MEWLGGTAGASAAELALVLPVLLLLLTGIVDFGTLLFKHMQVTAAAHAGVRYAIANGFDATKISTAITNATTMSGISASPAPSESAGCISSTNTIVTVTNTTTCSGSNTNGGTQTGTFVFVHASAPFSPMLPVWGTFMPSTVTANAVVMISQP
jgi:Flp pilus assembly protein TadG